MEQQSELDGWRFQGTDEEGLTMMFDVFREEGGWHVRRSYQ